MLRARVAVVSSGVWESVADVTVALPAERGDLVVFPLRSISMARTSGSVVIVVTVRRRCVESTSAGHVEGG